MGKDYNVVFFGISSSDALCTIFYRTFRRIPWVTGM